MTTGYGLSSVLPPPAQSCNRLVSDHPGMAFTNVNMGVDGSSSVDWATLGGGTPLANALILVNHNGYTNASILLGTNDSKPQTETSATDYETHMQFIIDHLRANGVTKIVLNQPPFIKPSVSGIADPASANALLVSYQTALSNLAAADPTHVFQGDASAYGTFEANPSYYQADGIHPSDVGATALAALWEAGYPVT